MDITKLSEASGVSVRTIKRYIGLGLVEPPVGRTRGAKYTEQHLADLEKIKEAQARGFKVGRLATALNQKAESGRARAREVSMSVFPLGRHVHILIDQDHTTLAREVQQAMIREMRQAFRKVVSK